MKNVTYINASAGSGKTYTLTHKLAELIKSGLVRPDQVIMTTFTVKAANEMKEEAKKVLYENGLFEASTQLDHAMIGTIHSVANSLIKKYWFFLGLSPDMGVMAEEDTQFYISQSLSELPTHEELNQLHAFCESVGIQYGYFSGKNGLNYDFWKSDIEKVIALTTNYEIESYDRSVKESLDFIHGFVHPSVKLDYSPEDLLAILDEHVTFAATQRESKKKQDVLTEVRRLRRGVNAPTISWYKRLSSVLNSWTKCGTQGTKIREELAELWHSELVYKEQERYIRLLFQLAERWKERFRTFKKERNLLDYNDMEKYLRDLLANKELAEEIRMGYRYLFVDEYQDCSPIQVKIFDRLSELMEHSYWVGDYKQAIYGFRGSDITLTKAVVDRIATGENGCDTETLDTSYRSLPGIVEVCNETFKRTFKDVLDEGAIVLKTHRTNDEKIHSVRLWDMEDPESVGIADHIAYLLKQGVNPSDIAVLGRTNAPLDLMAGILTGTYGIPANRQEVEVSEIKCTPLVLALLALVESEKDSLAKAQIAVLTEEGYGTSKIIEEKLLLDADEETKESAYLNDVPLVKRLLELRPMLKQQSVGALIETMVIELDLYNEIKKIGQVNESISCLDTIVQSGYAYEQHCLQMSLPASVKGFVDYLAVIDPAGKGNANGIQLHTYHSCKGLEWKYVILTQLYEKKNDPKKCVKQDIYGIHFSYSEQPSASTPYPEVFIRVIPFIYGAGNTNVPAEIQQQIEDSSLYKDVIKDSLAEANRLLYVGMTRPRDVLIVALESHKKDVHTLQWLEDVGLDCVRPDAEHDIFGVGCRFEDDTLTQEQFDSLSGYRYLAEDENMKTRRIPYHQEPCEEGAKYLSPSKLHVKGMVDASHQICEHMHQGTLVGKTMADVGNCIHQIFCGIEQHIDSESYYTNLIDSYGLATYLTDYAAIRNAWEKLVKWLTEQFGAAINIYHERPFTLLKDGNVFSGSIDLVWQTSDGDILIDFKTCPLGQNYILDSDSEHYAGWYAGQIDAYTDALEEAGEKVLKRFIYYPVSGMMCEIGRGFDYNPSHKEDVLHIFGVKGLDWEKAIHDTSVALSDNEHDATIKYAMYDQVEGWQRYDVLLQGASAQGLSVSIAPNGDVLHIEIPWLGSIWEVHMAVALAKSIMSQFPKSEIYINNHSEGQVVLNEDTENTLIGWRLNNMKKLIDTARDGQKTGAPGYYRQYIFPTREEETNLTDEELVFKAHDGFVRTQWSYANYETPSEARITPPNSDESFTARMLFNDTDVFVEVSQKLVIINRLKEMKFIDTKDFVEQMKESPYFEKVDALQFTLKRIPDEQWQLLWEGIDSEVICQPNTFLLRWNPAISSFKMEHYKDASTRFPDGFSYNWSVYEYENAHKGDRFYMLRVGEGNTGIVFRGTFTSEPYEGDDWAGKGKKRYYMDMNCFDAAAPDTVHITTEELAQAITDIDWEKGHSGQLLTDEQADKLDELWNSK